MAYMMMKNDSRGSREMDSLSVRLEVVRVLARLEKPAESVAKRGESAPKHEKFA